jgi:hypothetical protein
MGKETPMKSPGRIICHGCDGDLGTSGYDEDTGAWLYPCPDCVGVDGPLTLEVRTGGEAEAGLRGGGGIMADLGVYDGVKEALAPYPGQWLEFAVLEHLYAQVDRDAYRELVERYGHVAVEPQSNTASWMIGRAAWALQREGELVNRRLPRGSGRWAYLSPTYAWALPGTPEGAEVVTWEAFALAEGFSPHSHPAIDWRDTPNAAPPEPEDPSSGPEPEER